MAQCRLDSYVLTAAYRADQDHRICMLFIFSDFVKHIWIKFNYSNFGLFSCQTENEPTMKGNKKERAHRQLLTYFQIQLSVSIARYLHLNQPYNLRLSSQINFHTFKCYI